MRHILPILLAGLALPAFAEVPRVVTDLPPVGSLVAQVMGDLGAPVVLLDRGADPHAFQLRPSQAGEVAAAQAIIWVGPEMTPWLDRAADGLNGMAVDLRLLSVPGTMVLPFAGDEHGEVEHDHHDIDPHAWLDPDNARLWLGDIARVLADLDPANAATYAANAAAAQTAVQHLDAELQALLTPARTTPLIVFHNAYGYFAAHYGLNVLGAVSGSDAAPPGAAHLRDLQSKLAGTPACLFPETNHDPKLLDTLTGAGNLRVGAALDPEGTTLPDGPALYSDLLRAMATAIAACAAP